MGWDGMYMCTRSFGSRPVLYKRFVCMHVRVYVSVRVKFAPDRLPNNAGLVCQHQLVWSVARHQHFY